MSRNLARALSGLAASAILITARLAGAGDAEDLAKQAQNPISELITVPIEENLSFGGLEETSQGTFTKGFINAVNSASGVPQPAHIAVEKLRE